MTTAVPPSAPQDGRSLTGRYGGMGQAAADALRAATAGVASVSAIRSHLGLPTGDLRSDPPAMWAHLVHDPVGGDW